MTTILYWLYNLIGVPLFSALLHIAGLFHVKVKKGLAGRKGLFESLGKNLEGKSGKKRFWIHISSMGEYEQGKPVVDEILTRFPGSTIVMSFFSPSGFENVKNDNANIVITYLPMDSYFKAQKFVNIVNPCVALFVRHDIWPNHLHHLAKKQIPAFLIDASIPKNRQRSLKSFPTFYRLLYKNFTQILAVSQQNVDLIKTVYTKDVIDGGDTRFDRVYQRAMDEQKIEHILQHINFDKKQTFVAGSTWPSDEKVILPALIEQLQTSPNKNAVIAPHETTEEHVAAIEAHFKENNIQTKRFTELGRQNGDLQVLIVDTIGYLANLYCLGNMAFVGGGFGPGVHNVLEPAAHGTAVLFGPRHLNSVEALQMIDFGGCLPVNNENDFEIVLKKFFDNDSEISEMQNSSKEFVQIKTGSSKLVVNLIEKVMD